MLGTSQVKQYFATGDSHYVTPVVSAEWNYNLFYAPYLTFSGDGSSISSNWTTPSSWTKTNCTSSFTSGDGRYATAYPDKNVLKFFVTSQNGSAVLPISVPSGKDTYKIVFYAKIVESEKVTLSSLAYIDTHRSNSSSKEIDNTVWTKFELYASARPTDDTYSSFNLIFDFTSTDTTIASQVKNPPDSYTVMIDQIEIVKTTAFEYQYGNLWTTSSPFGFFRPGESYVPSGNALTPLPSGFRTVNTRFLKSFNNNNDFWPAKPMPCSPVIFHPQVLSSSKGNPLYKNGILSDYNTYRYFVSDGDTNSVGALYDMVFAANKIVIKLNINYSTPTSLNIVLSNTVTSYSYTKNITSIPESGVIILYRQSDGSWTTNAWSQMPTFNNVGDITNSQFINKIVVTQVSASINSTYNSPDATITGSRYTQYASDMKRLQVIEISPRIELDLTNFVMNVETISELDNKQNPLPISAISSNSATINLSNVPFSVSGKVLSLFSNNSSTSPLSGLFKKNVKFYINYLIRDAISGASNQEKVIPGGIFYAENWEGHDLQKTNVDCYDITKYLQLLSPTDYVSQHQDVFNIISNILDMSGFTDYDYDGLRKVTKSQTSFVDGSTYKNSQPISSSYFYADGQQQKVFDVLRELFEVYQIGAYINAYGVMEFLSLDNILSNTTANILLHDDPTPQQITAGTSFTDTLKVTSNITQDTYTETVKNKIGKATFRFKIPQVNKTYDIEGLANTQNLSTKIIDKVDMLWQLEKEDVSTFNYLNQSINNYSQNYFSIDPKDLVSTFNSFGVDHEGYGIIEGEIISFKDKEFKFSVSGDSNNYNSIVSNSSELGTAISEYSAKAGFSANVFYTPTGKICNVQRGAFNTPIRKHNIISNYIEDAGNAESVYSKMEVKSGLKPTVVDNKIIMNATTIGTNSVLTPIGETSSSSYPYYTFSTKMAIGPNSGNPFHNGMGGGIVIGYGTASPTYVEVRQDYENYSLYGKPSYHLYVYQNGVSLLAGDDDKSIDFININSGIIDDVKSYPLDSPFAEFGKTLHLKFVKLKDPKVNEPIFEIYINKHKIALQTIPSASVNTIGQYGIFAKTTAYENDVSGSIGFTELYATQTPLTGESIWYHWQLPSFANAIASGHKTFEINYMMQTRPQIFGINYYDIQYQLAPAINAYIVPDPYDWYYFVKLPDTKNKTTGKTDAGKQVLQHVAVKSDSLSYSNVYNSGFRGRFVIVNGSPSAIWLKKSPDIKNTIDVSFFVNTKNLIALSSEVAVEKIFDPANASEGIEIKSNWVQSKNAALSILKNIYRAVDGFSRDTEVSIYGNPLFEVGDVVQVNYSLKNIVAKKYFVQGVKQTFDQGLKTVLTLNEINSN